MSLRNAINRLSDYLNKGTSQYIIPDSERKAQVKKALMNFMTEAPYCKASMHIGLTDNDEIFLMQGGVESRFDAFSLISRIEYLINRDGLPIP